MKTAKMEVSLIDSMGNDISVVNAARVSFAKESEWEIPAGTSAQQVSERDQKLIAYLAKHNHWSPFAHAFLSFRIKAPIFVSRQLAKHVVGLAWNEVSRRYVDDEPEFWFPETWRGKPENAKQGSSEYVVDPLIIEGATDIAYTYNGSDLSPTEVCLRAYNSLIANGLAPEQARMFLPLNTMTEWIWSGSLMAFARVCKLRMDSHAQQECQDVARMIYNLVPEQFQYSWKALTDGIK